MILDGHVHGTESPTAAHITRPGGRRYRYFLSRKVPTESTSGDTEHSDSGTASPESNRRMNNR
jgi:hypothetical protein